MLFVFLTKRYRLQLQNLQLYANASAENLESSDFRVVTKKKKSKKRRNSLLGRRQQYSNDPHNSEFHRTQSPELRRKSACSVPHSEKSNDSSDVDSVHSLPIDTNRINRDSEPLKDDINLPISYADIAKNCNSLERPKWNRPPSERRTSEKTKEKVEKTPPPPVTPPVKIVVNDNNTPTQIIKQKSPQASPAQPPPVVVAAPIPSPKQTPTTPPTVEKSPNVPTQPVKNSSSPPDVNYMQNWPCIQNHKAPPPVPEVKTKNQQNTNKPIKNNIKNMKNAQMFINKPQSIKNTHVNIINDNINNNLPVSRILIRNKTVIMETYSFASGRRM